MYVLNYLISHWLLWPRWPLFALKMADREKEKKTSPGRPWKKKYLWLSRALSLRWLVSLIIYSFSKILNCQIDWILGFAGILESRNLNKIGIDCDDRWDSLPAAWVMMGLEEGWGISSDGTWWDVGWDVFAARRQHYRYWRELLHSDPWDSSWTQI